MQDAFYVKYVVFLLGSLIFALLMNSLFLKFVKTLGIRNTSTTTIRWSSESKPALGGITFYIIFLFSGALYPVLFGNSTAILSIKSIGILAATSLGFIMGLADDAYNTRPVLKSMTQLVCGLILVMTGTQIEVFSSDIFNKFVTLIWVVGIMNSLNMLDNMDGITGIVSFFVCLAIVCFSMVTEASPNLNFILVSGILTALLAFLYFNWHPAKMYMGDSGSQFLGSALSAMGIIYFWNPVSSAPETMSLFKHLLLPLLAFLIPIIDTTTVTINRIGNGQSPFVGGKDHTTHYLSRKGLGDKKVAYLIAFISMLSSLFVFLISTHTIAWKPAYGILFLLYAGAIFSTMFYFTRQKSR